MKKPKSTAPNTFLERVVEREESRHAGRRKEIKQMRSALVMAEPTIRSLEAQGLRIATESNWLSTCDRVLIIELVAAAGFNNPKLYNALVDLGFKEVKRYEHASFATAHLKKSRLTLSVSIPPNYQYAPQQGAA
ncbi:hypothetical protein D3870_09800 [Noviherbaspirillum cavernae]|uniref:Uncharacterized protein n=1 Tax=Noviherbaspirillum cavernae TaxID=2320862 RepID=A0A418X1F3_9BURK|nr:hypothetical protein [Noviherbaspirillum cavernae]RJG06266.1 hypothetical protein D3870_09800 [Noviherbaspirillum cavernae]